MNMLWRSNDFLSVFNKGDHCDVMFTLSAQLQSGHAQCSVAMLQEKGQLLENVFADPKGFGLDPSGKYRYEMPGFSSGTAAVS